MADDLQREYRKVVGAALAAPWPSCTRHGDRPAEAACACCEKVYCWECLRHEAADDRLVCVPCREAAAEGECGRRWVRTLTRPYLWVVGLALAALVAYLAGVGNPDPDSLSRRDRNRPWPQRRTAVLWLRQAARARARVSRLQSQGRQAESRVWARLATTALGRTGEAWRGEPPEPQVRIAEAQALADAGDAAAAWNAIRALDGAIPSDDKRHLAFLLHRGRLAIAAGQTEAGVADWRRILERTAEPASLHPTQALDAMLDKLSLGAVEGGVTLLLEQVSETGLTEYDVRERTLDLIMEHGLNNRFADLLRTARAPDPETEAGGPLTIEFE
ncbi:MAG: hypothetical protein BWZ02_00051 [Lentisphaerae bacterium ADurb.BinA184]|nr:MAG: hypothetical protein BWZ02_00051 [Lentisphaerae bacterium ADurb.BinA184]